VRRLVRIRWWWAFAAFIGIPAIVLAVIGIHTVDLQRAERRNNIAEQQSQVALLTDAALSSAFSRIEERFLQREPSSLNEAPFFSLDGAGRLVFWQDKVFFADPDDGPSESRTVLSPPLQAAAEEGLAEEARADAANAASIYEHLAESRELGAWARLSLARLRRYRQGDAFLAWIKARKPEDDNALTPDGTPVSLVAASWASPSLQQAPDTQVFLRSTLEQLRAGHWWLSFSQRKLYDAELTSLIPSAKGDLRLIELADIERAIRGAVPFRRDMPRLLIRGESGPLLLFIKPQPVEADGWRGIGVTSQRLSVILASVLGPERKTVSYPLAVADAAGGILWGDAPLGAKRVFPLHSINGWELMAGEPISAVDLRERWLWYGFVALLLLMLTLGILMTGRTVNREMELTRLQGEFAAGVTHEFKSPITGIRLLIERIMSGRVFNTADIREYCAAIRRETDHLDSLVNRLLETHRIQSGEKRYQIAPHCVADIAENAVARLRTHASAKRITVTLDADDSTREIDLDRTAVQDSIENLLDNSIKYSPPDTRIAITIRHEGRTLLVTVRDQGIGIDAADLPRIFDRFYRGRRGQTQSVSGTGLGLALVKATVEGHGGTVEVYSNPNAGTEFRIRIPIRQEETYVASVDSG